jgi:serpin (serine protease inhibitor)
MASVLKHTLSQQQIDAVNGQVLATLASYDRSAVPPTCPGGMQLIDARCQTNPDRNGWCPFSMSRVGDRCIGGATFPPSASLLAANALMLLNSPPVSADYAGLLKDKYAAEVFLNASLADVNGWVARKTGGKIDKILTEEEAQGANAVILSAVYFKSRWAAPFNEAQTKGEPFHVSATQQVQVVMMHQSGHLIFQSYS